MRIESFEPSAYTSPCGTIRIVRFGASWYAETLDETHDDPPHSYYAPKWSALAGTQASTANAAIARALEQLGLDEPDDGHRPYTGRDDIAF